MEERKSHNGSYAAQLSDSIEKSPLRLSGYYHTSQILWVSLVAHLCGCQWISMLAVITCCEQTIWPSASQLGTAVRRPIVFTEPPGLRRHGAPRDAAHLSFIIYDVIP